MKSALFAVAGLCIALGVTLGAYQRTVPHPTGQRIVPRCVDAFRPGQPIAIGIDFSCTDPTGRRQFVDVFRCRDGRHLVAVEARTGAPQGWGHDGGPFHVGNSAVDPEYRQAYRRCIN